MIEKRLPFINQYDLSGYVLKGKPVIKNYQGKRYSIQQYQQEHEDEYTVMEINRNGVGNGNAQLFRKGILQMSWLMNNGEREGELTVYKDGVIDRILRWDDLREASKQGDDYHLCSIVNSDRDKEMWEEMIVGSRIVVYRGEIDKETRKREGFGIEYDEVSGVEKRSGYFKKGKLVHLCQEFEEEEVGEKEYGINRKMKMIEYGGEMDENNVDDITKRFPIYIGDYRFDSKEFKFIRNGLGNVLNEYSGICSCICEWNDKGEKIIGNEIVLNGGWKGKGRGKNDKNQSIRVSQLEKIEEEERPYWNEKMTICSGLQLERPRGTEEFIIGNNELNGSCWFSSYMKMDLRELKRLNIIDIGNECFQNVREFVVDGLERLESVKIGGKCFQYSDCSLKGE